MIIKASASLRNNYTEISKQCHETGEPIYITKNGEGDLVVMSIEAYEKLVGIIQGQNEILNGKFYSSEEAKRIIFDDRDNPEENFYKTRQQTVDKVAEEDEKYEV